MDQRGTTLIEVLIAAAAVAILAAAAEGLALGAHPLAMRTAVSQFDASLAYAQALAASSGNGATILLDGQSLSVFSGRPTAAGALQPAGVPPIALAGVRIAEASLGAAPLAIFVDGSGHASMEVYAGATPAPLAAEPPCPGGGAWMLTISDARAQAVRTIPCPRTSGSSPGP